MGTRVPVLAKLSRPRLPRVAVRERLYLRLNAFQDFTATWVCGPAGSGKTTLVSDYLRTLGKQSFWFHVDEGDQDPSAMISYLVALARQIDPNASRLPYLTPEHLTDIANFYRQFFRQFYQILPAECAVVFDNCHRASAEAFHAILRSAIDEAPNGVRLFALSRHQLPIDFVKAQAHRQIGVVGAKDLRLDITETRAVMTVLGAPTRTGIDSLHALCDGWVAGLILILSQSQESCHDRPMPRLDPSSRESVFRYFADELFESADSDLRTLLLHTALLPTVTSERAQELTGNVRSGELLEGMYQRHFFTVRRETKAGAGAISYAYHDLFRAFLLQRLEVDVGAGDLVALRTKVASILERSGIVSDAIEQYRVLGYWADVTRLIRSAAREIIDHGRIQTLGDWLDFLPDGHIAADPWLLLYSGHVLAMTNPARAVTVFESAYDRFVLTGNEAGQFDSAFATIETMMMSSVSYKPWDHWIDILARLLESRPPEDRDTLVRAWHTLLYTCLYRRPSHALIDTAVLILDRELFSDQLQPTQAIRAATGLLAYAHFCCDESLAARVMPELRRWLAGEQLAVMSRILGCVWMAVYHYFDARYREALHWTGISVDLAQRHGFHTIAEAQAWYRVQSMAHLGEREAAFAEASRLQAGTKELKSGSPAAYAATAAALAHFVSGDKAGAKELGEQGLRAWNANGFILARLAWAQSMQAIYRLDAGNTEAAIALIRDSEAGLAGTVCNYPDALYALLRAQSALSRQNRAEAIEHMQTCMAFSSNHKRIAILSWARPFLPGLFSLAWEAGIARAKIAELVAEWSLSAPTQDEQNWPRSLEIFLLGDFEVRSLGSRIDFGRKPPRKLLALLKAIAIGGERGLSVDSARDLFWPDLEGDAAVAAQTAALYRLRRILGTPEAVRLVEGRLTLDPQSTWVDAVALERLAKSAIEKDRLRALSLYRGPLLPHDEEEAWTTATRLRLRDVFSRLVEHMAMPLETTDIESAERLYLRGVEAEPLAEASYRGLMRCHAQRGRMAEVAAVYRRLRQTLSVVLSIEPSVESERLRSDILKDA